MLKYRLKVSKFIFVAILGWLILQVVFYVVAPVLCLCCRGVGCIFTEMISGQATFPGMKDAYDQLDKIFKVSLFFLPFAFYPCL